MFDIKNPDHKSRLAGALKWSRDQMRPYRERAKEAWDLYVGDQYGQDVSKKVYLPLMAQVVDTFVDRLAAHSPRVAFNPVPQNARYVRPAAKKLERLVNARLKRERFEKVIQCAVSQALFGIGAVKIGLRQTGVSEYGGETFHHTGPYCAPILMEDLVVDMRARSHEHYAYIGHRYEMFLDEAVNNPQFDKAARQTLKDKTELPGENDDLLQTLGVNPSEVGSYVDTITLWDVYLSREKLLITLAGDFETVLAARPWTGPEQGPILPLYLRYVPGNAMPRGFALDIAAHHEAANELYRKLVDQAKRQKTVTFGLPGDSEWTETARVAPDGGCVTHPSPGSLVEKPLGGIHVPNLEFLMQLVNDGTKHAGNVDLLSGLAQQSDTLGQDQILNANSSRLLEALGAPVQDFVASVLQQYAWYLWTDPIETYPVEVQIEGQWHVEDELPPEERTFDFFDMLLDVAPYSMSRQTPAAKLQAIQGTVTNMILPLLPLMQQQNLGLDLPELLKMTSELMGLPDLARIVTSQGQSLDSGSARPPEQRKPIGGPPRQYVRTSVNGNPQENEGQQRLARMATAMKQQAR